MPDFAKALRGLRPPESSQRHLFQAESPATSLVQQLQFLKARLGQTATPTRREPEILPEGSDQRTPFGTHYVMRAVFDSGHYHGKIRLNRFSCVDLQHLMLLMREKGSAPPRESIVFLDTETTGIQGGTGTCPFLIGLGFFVDDDFHMIQYFIRDFDEEPSMLYALAKFLERFRLVVTYNGGSFDIPLLEARFTLARLDNPLVSMPHLDLLTSARRLWRNTHGSCRLAALEARVAGFLRGPDVPGAMIPRAYFDYLAAKPASVLCAVFRHNVHDVISLAALTVSACDCATTEPATFDEPTDLYSMGRLFEHTPDWRRSLTFYEMALDGELPETFVQKAMENLASLCRRAGMHERAVELCQRLMTLPEFSIVAYEGAAIHYERVVRDPSRALEVVEAGLFRLAEGAGNTRWRKSLAARRERLQQKVIQFPV